MVLTTSGRIKKKTNNDFLAHYGILGMKWGIRRFQPYSVHPRKGGEGGKEVGDAKKKVNKYRYNDGTLTKKGQRKFEKDSKRRDEVSKHVMDANDVRQWIGNSNRDNESPDKRRDNDELYRMAHITVVNRSREYERLTNKMLKRYGKTNVTELDRFDPRGNMRAMYVGTPQYEARNKKK